MFNVCRRGAAPISRIAVAATSNSLSTVCKQSILPLSAGKLQKSIFPFRSFHSSNIRAYEGAATASLRKGAPVDGLGDGGELITKFQDLADLGLVNKVVIDGIVKGMGHENMTRVQSMTINETLKGTDVIAQAKTGTGKTLGFLIPVVQNILSKSPELATPPKRFERVTPSDIRAIIMSPTRELAEQIGIEAQKITRGTGLKVQVAVGGVNKKEMLRQTQREGCHLLVATPGRLHDLLNDPYSKIAAPDLGCLVLDEADRLLDAGFSLAIEGIVKKLPDRRVRDRQTLLFSATVPREVMGLVRSTLKPGFKFVQTVQEGDVETHQKVPQKLVTLQGMENVLPTIVELAKREMLKESGMPFKAIVYYNATALVELAHETFYNMSSPGQGQFGKHPLDPCEIYKIHAKMTQQGRTRAADRFRRAKTGILFSSDVTARGMDFPNVSHVIQVGISSDRDTYVHRIGRTGRGDKQGEGWTLVTPDEARAVPRALSNLPLVPDQSLEVPKVDMTRENTLPGHIAATLQQVSDATQKVPRNIKVDAYVACLGQHAGSGSSKHMQISTLIEALNQWSRFGWAMAQPPFISPSLATKLRIRRTDGANIGTDPDYVPSDRNDSAGGRSGGFGGRSSGFGGDRGGRGGSSFGGDRRGGSSFGGDRRGGGSFGGRDGGDRGGFGGGRDGGDRGGFGGGRGGSSFGGGRGGSNFGGRGRTGSGGSNFGRGRTGSGGFGGDRGGGRGGFDRGSDRGGSGGFGGRERRETAY